MSKKRLKNRQRVFLNTRMRILVASSVAFLVTILLIIYFNFFDVKNSRAFSSGDYRTSGSGEWDETEIWEVFDGVSWSPAMQPPGEDVHSITIGNNTNIQDGAIIHCTYQRAKSVIGSNVSIAHNAIVHGCTVEDNVLVGMGAIIMDGAVIGSNSVIAAGAIILPGTIVESGSMWAGNPAKRMKDISDEMREVIQRTAKNYPMYAEWFK